MPLASLRAWRESGYLLQVLATLWAFHFYPSRILTQNSKEAKDYFFAFTNPIIKFHNMKFNKLIIASIFISISLVSFAKKKKKGKKEEEQTVPITIVTKEDTLSYAIGYNMGKSLKQSSLDTLIDLKLLEKGMKQALDTAEPIMNEEKTRAFLQAYFQKMQEEQSKAQFSAQIEEGEKFLVENKSKEGVVETASGLQYQIITEGSGAKPTAQDQVTVHYTGTLLDGTVFDSSVERGEPATFPVKGVISGWTEALQLMSTGSKWKLFIPSELAYGARGAGQSIPPYSTLIFEVELLSIQ